MAKNKMTACGKRTCPLIETLVRQLAAEQVRDDHNHVRRLRHDDFNYVPEHRVTTVMERDVGNHNLTLSWYREGFAFNARLSRPNLEYVE